MRVGVDAQSIDSVRAALAEFGDRYRERLFTLAEVNDCGGPGADPSSSASGLAARFAAKEATLKALRVTDRVPELTDIEVVRNPGGWPSLRLSGIAAVLAAEAGLAEFEVSLSHADPVALAVVVASGPSASDTAAQGSARRAYWVSRLT